MFIMLMSRTRTRRYLEPLSGCFVGLGKYESIYLSRSSTEYPLRGFLFSTVPFLDGCNRTGMTPAIAIQADWGKVDVKPHISVAKLVPILRTTGGCSDSVLGKLLKAPKDRLGALKPFGIGRYDMSNKSINKLLKRAMINSWRIDRERLSDNEYAALIPKTSRKFMVNKSWKQLRVEAIEKYGNKCCKCGRVGSKRYPINIDHIKPRKYYPELAMDINNLQPLCGRCNREKGNNHCIDYRSPCIVF